MGSTLRDSEFLGFKGVVLSVVDDVSVDSEASVVTSSILRIYQPSLRGVSVCVVLCNSQKKT